MAQKKTGIKSKSYKGSLKASSSGKITGHGASKPTSKNTSAKDGFGTVKKPTKTSPANTVARAKAGLPPMPGTQYTGDAAKYYKGTREIVQPKIKPEALSPEYSQWLGDTTFKSGNPEIDKFINDVYIPLIESSFSNNPTAIFDDAAFKTYKDRIDKTWGPIFERELKTAQEAYDRSVTGLKEEAGFQKEQLGLTETRNLEDTRIGKQRIARNLDEAKQESSMAMAARGLTFGGSRRKAETKLEQAAAESASDLEKESKRTLEDIAGKRKFYGLEGDLTAGVGEYGRQLQEKQVGFEEKKRELEGEKQLQYESELTRLRNLGSSILNSQYNK
jgi:hypothetical protein